MPPSMPAAAISLRFGLDGLPGRFGCSISEKRSPFDSTSMRSPTWAWPTLATAALYWFWVLASSRSSPASTCSLAGVAWIDLSRSSRVFSIVASSSAMNFSRASIGASSTSSSEVGGAGLAVGAGHRARLALVVDQLLQRGELVLQHADPRAGRGVDRALLHQLVLQRVELLLLGAELAGGGRAAGALEHPDHGGALVLEVGFLALAARSAAPARGSGGCAARPGCRAATRSSRS